MDTNGQRNSDTLLAQAGDLEARRDPDQARRLYRDALALQPRNYRALTRLALLEYRRQAFDSAIDLLQQADAAYPHDCDILLSLGLSYQAAWRVSESIACFEKIIQLRPDRLQAYLSLASALQAAGRIEAARDILVRAHQLELLDAHGQCLYARLLEQVSESRRSGSFDDAITAYRTSLALDPDNTEPAARLALLLEKINRIDEAETVASRGLARSPDNPWLRLALAKCRYRQQRYAEGIACLQCVNIRACPPQLQVLIGSELGALYDKSGACDEAYAWFSHSNDQAGKLWDRHNREPETYIHKMQRLLAQIEGIEQAAPPLPVQDEHTDPVFLIGFPRSGTTLLDQILDSHAGIHTLEEIPIFDRLLERTRRLNERYTLAMDKLSTPEVSALRAAYFEAVAQHARRSLDGLLVDKQPLNIGNLLLIHRLFPKARYIFAIRHPCDACLSCFMQSFSFTASMASFYSLHSTVELYDLVMRLWLRFEQVLDLDAHPIRYEDVVEDLEGEIRRLLAFLGLEWDQNMRHFDRHARTRLAINTPSYRQVRQPIYHSSVYRWQGYRRHLEPFLPVLKTYIERFGYTDSC